MQSEVICETFHLEYLIDEPRFDTESFDVQTPERQLYHRFRALAAVPGNSITIT